MGIKRRLSVLFVSELFPPYIVGGAEVSTSLLAEELSKGNEIKVLTSNLSPESWYWHGIEVKPLLHRHKPSDQSIMDALAYAVSIIATPIRVLFSLLNHLKYSKAQLVNVVATSYTYFLPIYVLSYLVPVVVDVRDFNSICLLDFSYEGYVDESKKHNCYHHLHKLYKNQAKKRVFPNYIFGFYEVSFYSLYRRLLKQAALKSKNIHFIAISEYVKNKMVQNGYPKAKITVVPNIAEPSDRILPLAKRRKQFITAGRLEKSKGIWQALQGFQTANLAQFKLVICGTGDQYEPLAEYIRKYKLSNVILMGHVTPQEVTELYRKSYAVLAPVIRPEPFGRFIQESLTAGTPVIASCNGGIPEGLTWQTGTLLKDSSAPYLSEAIKHYARVNRGEYQKIQAAISRRLRSYAASTVVQKRLNIYREVLARSASSE